MARLAAVVVQMPAAPMFAVASMAPGSPVVGVPLITPGGTDDIAAAILAHVLKDISLGIAGVIFAVDAGLDRVF